MLDGLRLNKRIGAVKAVSGVSGGGAALAYFAAHCPELVAGNQEAWDRYHEAMAYHYFIDVLRGASEFRIPYQTSISTLLAESFDRQLFKTDDERKLDTLGAARLV